MKKICNQCKSLAMIPFIEHERQMFKAYQREKGWKIIFIGSNLLWLLGAIIFAVR